MQQSNLEKINKKEYLGLSLLISVIISMVIATIGVLANSPSGFLNLDFFYYILLISSLVISLPLFASLALSLKTLSSFSIKEFKWKVPLFSFLFALVTSIVYTTQIDFTDTYDLLFLAMLFLVPALIINLIVSIITSHYLYKKYNTINKIT